MINGLVWNMNILDIGLAFLEGVALIVSPCILPVLPLVLADPKFHLLSQTNQWMLYLPVMLFAFVFMVPLIIIAESRRKMKQIFSLSIALLAFACVLLATSHHSLWAIGVALFIFFTGFNTLEASLPSLISKYAPTEAKGPAVGVYDS